MCSVGERFEPEYVETFKKHLSPRKVKAVFFIIHDMAASINCSETAIEETVCCETTVKRRYSETASGATISPR